MALSVETLQNSQERNMFVLKGHLILESQLSISGNSAPLLELIVEGIPRGVNLFFRSNLLLLLIATGTQCCGSGSARICLVLVVSDPQHFL